VSILLSIVGMMIASAEPDLVSEPDESAGAAERIEEVSLGAVSEPEVPAGSEEPDLGESSEDQREASDVSGSDEAEATNRPAPRCPCEVEDWRCWTRHREACNRALATRDDPTSNAVPDDAASSRHAPVETPELPTPGPRHEPEPMPAERLEPERHGLLVALHGGFLGCSRGWCDSFEYGGGGLGGLELGYRHGFIGVVAGVAGGAGSADPVEIPELGPPEAHIRFLDAGIGVVFHFVQRGRVDPFVSARIGYTRADAHIDNPQTEVSAVESVKRGGVRVGFGLPLYVGPRVSVGPRFDVTLPFAGELCFRVRGPGGSFRECTAVRNLEEEVMIDSSGLPLPWAVTLDIRMIVPPW
jgi:hypothetical protein